MLIEYSDASPAVRAVFDGIKASRGILDVNNFWKALARDPETLRRVWEGLKAVMAPSALDPLTKELLYLAVSVGNGCAYCAQSHERAASRAGMMDAQHGEFLAVVGMAHQTNRLAWGYAVPLDAPSGGGTGSSPPA